MTALRDAIAVAAACRALPNLGNAILTDEYYYSSLTLCVIDAVYSIGVRYESVQNVVARYCRHYGLDRYRPNPSDPPLLEAQESLASLISKLSKLGPTHFASCIFQNRQRTSSRGGILKAEAVLLFAKALSSHGVNYFQDLSLAMTGSLESAIKSIPGQGSGISLGYFFMLSGSDAGVKPDRMILRFLTKALCRPVPTREAQELVTAACEELREDRPDLTPRLLDYCIWLDERKNS